MTKPRKSFWLRVADIAAFVRNLVKKDKTNESSYEKFWGSKPKTVRLKVFGCLAYVNNGKQEKSKLDPKARKRTAFPLQDIETRKLTRARNVMCDEKKIVGFTNEPRKEENDLVFDVNFGDETKAEDNENIVIVESEDESTEAEVKSEVEVDEENSWNSETENQVEISRSATDNPDSESVIEKKVGSCRNYTLTPEARAPPIPPRMSIGPSPLRPS